MSKRHFEVGAPRQSIRNSADKAEVDQAIDLLAERLAPVVAKLLEGEAPATNGSNGRKIRSEDLTSRYTLPKGDEFDTLPDGDGWSSYDMNNPPGDESRNPYTPTGEHFDGLPTD